RRSCRRRARTAERVQGSDALVRHRPRRRRADHTNRQGRQDRAARTAVTKGHLVMTRAIDGLVNVDLGDREQPDWMVRVKEDYFKGGDSFFKSPELSELLDDMDANGVEKAILLANVNATEGRALSFVESRPDRFALGVGGFNLLKPMRTVRGLESFARSN